MQEHSSGKVPADDFASGEALQQLVAAIFRDLARTVCVIARPDFPPDESLGDSDATDLVEPPELIADRIITFAEIVGKKTSSPGTDCGLGGRVHPQIAWAKLRSPARRRGDLKQQVVEMNSKVPVRDERNEDAAFRAQIGLYALTRRVLNIAVHFHVFGIAKT